jgi:hypothetical protein
MPMSIVWRPVLLTVIVVAVSACATKTVTNERNPNPTPIDNTTTPSVVLNRSTVDDLLGAIANAGLPAPNPRDVTPRDCPSSGCTIKVETDTVSIMEFPTPGAAQLYAGSTQGCFQITDVVLTFSTSVPAGQRSDYERAVQRVIE